MTFTRKDPENPVDTVDDDDLIHLAPDALLDDIIEKSTNVGDDMCVQIDIEIERRGQSDARECVWTLGDVRREKMRRRSRAQA